MAETVYKGREDKEWVAAAEIVEEEAEGETTRGDRF